jgi:hypothetical protein
VAKILDTRQLVINRGAADGVQVGMRFAVLDPGSAEVIDPDTNQPLGELPRPKVQVEVVRVEGRFSVARTFKSRRVNVGGVGGLTAFGGIFDAPRFETQYETFKIDDAASQPLDERDSFVKVGDPVEQILSGEESPPSQLD